MLRRRSLTPEQYPTPGSAYIAFRAPLKYKLGGLR